MAGDLIGMQLLGTVSGGLTGTHVTTNGATGTTIGKGVVALWTQAAAKLTFTACIFDGINKPSGENVSAAVFDGVQSSPHYGSTDLTFDGCTYDVTLDGAQDYTIRACVRFNGTQSVVVTGGLAECQAETAPQTQELFNIAGVHSYDAGTVTVTGLTINAVNQNDVVPRGTTYAIGVLDGGVPGEIGTHASNDVLLNGLQIRAAFAPPVTAVGVWLRDGGAGFARNRARLFNSRIVVSSLSGANTGVAIENQDALIDYNTVRYGECQSITSTACSGTGVGLELIETYGSDVEVFANTFSTQSYTAAASVTTILDLTSDTTKPGVTKLAYTAYGGDGPSPPSPALYRSQVPSAAKLPVLASSAPSGAPGGGAVVSNNAPGLITFCGATDIVSATTSAGLNAVPPPLASDSDYATVGSLLVTGGNNIARRLPSFDAGATERSCP